MNHGMNHDKFMILGLIVQKPYVSAFQNFFWIENPLNIKEVMKKNVFRDLIPNPFHHWPHPLIEINF